MLFFLLNKCKGSFADEATFKKGSILILYSDKSESKFEPPYANIAIINEYGLIKVTDDNFYNNSPSYSYQNQSVYFESKRKRPILGLSEKSSLFNIRLSQEQNKPKEINLNIDDLQDPEILPNDTSLLAFHQIISDSSFLMIYNLRDNEEIFKKYVGQQTLLDYFLADPFIIIYNYDVPPSDSLKIQLFNFRTNKKLNSKKVDGKKVIQGTLDKKFYFSNSEENKLTLFEYLPESDNLNIIGRIELPLEEYDLVQVIDSNEYLVLEYLDNSNKLYHLDDGNLKEIFQASVIEDVIFLTNKNTATIK